MKLDKVKPVDLSAILALPKIRNRIHRVGIELEGGWTKLPEGVTVARDGSVHVKAAKPEDEKKLEELANKVRNYAATETEQAAYRKLHQIVTAANAKLTVGEIPSKILDLAEWREWVKQHYPSHVNETCGMHVHMSFQRALTYQRCMDPVYPKTVLEYIGVWAGRKQLPSDHPLWPRLEGKNEFCQHTFYAVDQAKAATKVFDHNRPGNRYSVVNYCYTQHSTFEVRLLPMMETSALAIEAIEEVFRITNAFLQATRGKEERIRTSIVIEPTEVRESFVELL